LKKQFSANKKQYASATLKGWQKIAGFLGEPVSVVHRWAAEGMPVHREGRFVSTSPENLNAWLGQESGKPIHVATDNADLSSELQRGLSFVRRGRNSFKKEESTPRVAKRK
jgi:hypothetical protein